MARGTRPAYAAILVALFGLPAAHAAPAPQPEPVQVSIGGGTVDSAAFRWSSALAQILSRPPGLPRCDPGVPCGVPGVVANAETYDQPQVLVKAIADGRVATGILPALDVLAGRCPLSKGQTPPPLRVLKALYRQPLQIVLRADSAIAKPKDFAGKSVVVGERGSDSETVALALLDAYGVPRAKVRLVRLAPRLAVTAISSGAVAASIFVGHAFDIPIGELMADGGYTLLSLPDTPERGRLLRMLPVFAADAIPPGTYPAVPAISTVAQSVFWVTGPALGPDLAQNLVADISEPHNSARLASLTEPVAPVPEAEAFVRLPAPLAEGAERLVAARHLPTGLIDCPPAGGK